MKRQVNDSDSEPEDSNQHEAVMEFHDLFHQACCHLANRSPSTLGLFNGCAHEGDRILRLAFESGEEDGENGEDKNQHPNEEIASSIDDEFYLAYADSIFYIGMLSDEAEKRSIAMETALEIYQNADSQSSSLASSLRKQRCNLVKNSAVSKEQIVEFFSSFSGASDEQAIEFAFLSSIAFDWSFSKQFSPLCFRQICCKALYESVQQIEEDDGQDAFSARIISEIYLAKAEEFIREGEDIEKRNENRREIEEAFECALDWIEFSMAQATSCEDFTAHVDAVAVNGLILWKALQWEGKASKKGEMIRGMLKCVVEVIEKCQETEWLHVDFLAVYAEVKEFVAGIDEASEEE